MFSFELKVETGVTPSGGVSGQVPSPLGVKPAMTRRYGIPSIVTVLFEVVREIVRTSSEPGLWSGVPAASG